MRDILIEGLIVECQCHLRPRQDFPDSLVILCYQSMGLCLNGATLSYCIFQNSTNSPFHFICQPKGLGLRLDGKKKRRTRVFTRVNLRYLFHATL